MSSNDAGSPSKLLLYATLETRDVVLPTVITSSNMCLRLSWALLRTKAMIEIQSRYAYEMLYKNTTYVAICTVLANTPQEINLLPLLCPRRNAFTRSARGNDLHDLKLVVSMILILGDVPTGERVYQYAGAGICSAQYLKVRY
jgi:hypothetical protein